MSTELTKAKPAGEISYVPFGASDAIKLTVGIVQTLCCTPTKKGNVCSREDAMKFIMLCQAQHLNPFSGDAYLVGYDTQDGPKFSMITAHLALLKRAEACPGFEGMESGIIIQEEDGKITEREGDFVLATENVVGGWAKVYRQGRRPTYRRLSVAQRRPKYETQFWSKDKAPEQIVKCAEADALRATFPTMIGGCYTGSEIIDISSERVTSNGIATNRLVESVGEPSQTTAAQREVQPATAEPEPAKEEGSQSPQDALRAFVCDDCKLTFDTLQKYLVESGLEPKADAMSSFDDVPAALVARLLKAKKGLKDQLVKTAEVEAQ